ncbi:hypothetical protein LUZ61_014110 [Rhynchospora tenuis]|uniref:3'-5' exonuclease domain-containing protein n=1 Tax=Rhynchospora tenuis TaxID=198213 RepID=A0AAD5WAG1_9POAL|nr:hypothetical protein LUZ61_014110 [Rhynchospora tenuis]
MRNFNNTGTYLIRAGGDLIKTTVTDSGDIVSNLIDDILRINGLNLNNLIVGLDIEFCHIVLHGTSRENRVALLKLCVGQRRLLFQLIHADYIPDNLSRLLSDNRFRFVGVGIRPSLVKLERIYGLKVGVRVVNLLVLAALKFGWPHMRQWNLPRLLWECTGIELQEKPTWICHSDWSRLAVGNTIEATVTKSGDEAVKWIDNILHSCSILVVGLNIKCRIWFNGNREARPVVLLQLCVGRRCLIFQLLFSDTKLRNFLGDDRYQFVGVGVKENAEKLYQWYGLNVGSCEDLRDLAAKKTGQLDMRYWDLQSLAREFMGVCIEKPRWVCLSNWSRYMLETEQIEYAALDAFASFEVGRKLVDGKASKNTLEELHLALRLPFVMVIFMREGIVYNPVDSTFNITFNNYTIKTTVTACGSVASNWIDDILRNHSHLNQIVVGLDVEWCPNRFYGTTGENPAALLQLCVSDRCLIFQLIHSDYIPAELSDFFFNNRLNFVGVGVTSDFKKLEKEAVNGTLLTVYPTRIDKADAPFLIVSFSRTVSRPSPLTSSSPSPLISLPLPLCYLFSDLSLSGRQALEFSTHLSLSSQFSDRLRLPQRLILNGKF